MNSADQDTGKNDPRLNIVRNIFDNLNKSSTSYALLHNTDDLSRSLDSDFDIILSKNPQKHFHGLIKDLCKKYNLVIVHILHYEVPHGYYYILATQDVIPEFIHIDCLYDPIGINRYHLPTTRLLSGTRFHDGYYSVNEKESALYLLIKRAIKPGLTADRYRKLKEILTPDIISALHDDIIKTFGEDGCNRVNNITSSGKIELANTELIKLGHQCEQHYRINYPFKYITKQISNLLRKTKRFLYSSGFFIVVIGPDGCGKTTITNELKKILARSYRKQYHFHWRPGLLPKLGNKQSDNKNKPASNAPVMQSKYKGPISYMRFAYYTMDFIIGYWIKLYPIKAQTTLIIGERYYADIAVHPARYGFSTPKWLIHLMGLFVPKPDLIILLSNDPEVIHNRKDELSIDTIRQQLDAYNDEIKRWGNPIIVDTNDTPLNIASAIAHTIIDRQSKKTINRIS